MAIDTQSIASFMVLSSTPVNVMIPPIASSIRVRIMKKVLEDFAAVDNVLLPIFCGWKSLDTANLNRRYMLNIDRMVQISGFSSIPDMKAGA